MLNCDLKRGCNEQFEDHWRNPYFAALVIARRRGSWFRAGSSHERGSSMGEAVESFRLVSGQAQRGPQLLELQSFRTSFGLQIGGRSDLAERMVQDLGQEGRLTESAAGLLR